MYADDLIILATTPEELQKSLDGLSTYCKKWNLNVNVKKTKCMTFSKGSNTRKIQFKIDEKPIEMVKEYKYLGITVNARNCSFSPTMTNLSNKATRAIFAITSKLPYKSAPVKTLLKLFDSCIAPILTYGSEIWAAYTNHDWKNWDTTEIERVHTQFLKRVLGVNRSTTNVMVRGELGRHSLQERILKRNVNFINYAFNKDASTLVHQALKYEESKCTTRNTVFSLFQRHEQQLIMDQENQIEMSVKVNEFAKTKVREGIRSLFDNEWKTHLNSFTKADCYKQFKSEVKCEKYLQTVKNRKHRVTLSKLRLSDHILEIETGRHNVPITPRELRFCPHCINQVESEQHFLIQCPEYNRTILMDKFSETYPQFRALDNENKFIFMLSQENEELTKLLANYLHTWMMQRLDFRNAEDEEMVQYIVVFAHI